ncbi:hypothetical protein D3C73_1252230 [compost metagenome]
MTRSSAIVIGIIYIPAPPIIIRYSSSRTESASAWRIPAYRKQVAMGINLKSYLNPADSSKGNDMQRSIMIPQVAANAV